MDRMIRDDDAVINLDLKFAIVLVISAVLVAVFIIPTLSHEERDWRIKQYMMAVRVSDNLVQETGTPSTWEANWTPGNYSNVKKIGLTHADANGIPVQKVLNLSKVTALMGEGSPFFEMNGTNTSWWEFPNSTTSPPERENATRALGLEGYSFYLQLHPVSTEYAGKFNSTPLDDNLTTKIKYIKDRATVIDRYVYIKDPLDTSPTKFLTDYNNRSIHYRLNLWVW